MKDAYSFNESQESLQETYDAMSVAYGRICERCGLDYRPVEADSGQIGGKVTTEFMALADAGEAELVTCPSCGYAADNEAGACVCHPTVHEVDALTKLETPGVATIAELAAFLDIPSSSTVKALCGIVEGGKDEPDIAVALFIPGDHELNELKAQKAFGNFRLMTDEEMEERGLPKGSIGPVGLPAGVKCVCDVNLKDVAQWAVGANDHGFHFVGARPGADFQVDEWVDLSTVQAGDDCPTCGATLDSCRGIEVSQVFQLGTKYSETMGATYLDANGKEQHFIMGCYGVGVTRTLAAVVEQHNDEAGIIWPNTVAPANVVVVPLGKGGDDVSAAAEDIAAKLAAAGLDVALDDRKERPGVKFADADLVGWPLQVIVGKRGLDAGNVELKVRATGERTDVPIADIVARVESLQ